MLHALGKSPQPIEERTAILEIVGNELAIGIETGAVALILDAEHSCANSRRACWERYFVDGSLRPVGFCRSLGHLGGAFLDAAQLSCLTHLPVLALDSWRRRNRCRQEEPLGLLLREQVDVVEDGGRKALRLHVLQRLAALQGNSGGNALELHHVDLAVAASHQLGRSIADAVDIDGENGHAARRDGEARQLHAAGLQPHVLLRAEVLQALVVVHKDEAAALLGTYGPAQGAIVALLQVLAGGELRLHRGQLFAIVVHEQVERAQHVVLRIGLSELAERCLEVVGQLRQVVVGRARRALSLVQGGDALRVGSAVIHIVAQQVAARAQLHQRHRVGIFRIDEGTAMIGRGHSATQLAGEVRIGLVALVHLFVLLAQEICAYGRRRAEALEVEGLIVIARRLFDRLVPEAVGIVAVEGQHLAVRHRLRQLRPSGTGVERQVEAYFLRHPLQRQQVVARAAIFVVELSCNDGAAIFPLQSLHLRENLPIELLYISQEGLVLGTQLAALRKNPVRNTAIAHLTMTERPDAQHDGHLFLTAHLEEAAQIALSVPAEDGLLLLDMVPKHVGGNHRDAAFLDLAHLLLPFVGRNARVVDLTHDGAYSPSVNHQAITVPRHDRHLG